MEIESLAVKISRSDNLPVLPEIVRSVLKLADDADSSARELELMIERDPAIAAKILRAANSSYYGLKNIPTVGRALSVLGLNTIRSLVISISFQQMTSNRQHSHLFDKIAFWKHCMAAATAAKIIGKLRQPLRAEELYTAGMLHDVGMLVLDRFEPIRFDQAISLARKERLPLYDAERTIFDYDHAAVGGMLAEIWQLPQSIQAAITYHHDVAGDSDHLSTTSVIAVADSLAHQVGLTNNSPAGVTDMHPLAEELVELPTEQLTIIGNVVLDEVQRTQDALQIAA